MNASSEKSYTVRYGAILACFWMCYAVLSSYCSFFLLESGFSNTVIGIVMALSSIIAALVQPVLANWADQEKSPSVQKITFGIALLLAVLTLLILVTRQAVPKLCLAFYVLALVALNCAIPFLNVLGMDTMNQNKPISYGISRAFGSVGFGIASFVMGLVSVRLGANSVPAFGIVFAVAFAAFSFVYPLEKRVLQKPSDPTQGKAESSSIFMFFKRYPRFMLVILGFAFVYVSHCLLNNFTLQVIQPKGGSNMEMGLCMMIAVAFETIPMVFFGWFSRQFRLDTLLKISVISYFLKNLLSLLAPNMGWYYVAQAFQFTAWGFSALFLVLYADQAVRPEDSVKGQAFAAAANTVGTIIASLAGGRLLDVFGVNPMLWMGLISSAIGSLVVILAIQRTEGALYRGFKKA